MSNDDIHSLSGAYAVDAVDDFERARFEAHLAGCAQCQTEVASLRAAAGELSLGTIATPPPALRASVLRGISAVRPLPPLAEPASLESRRARRAPLRQWLAGVAAAAVLATGALAWHPWSSEPDAVQLTATQQVLQAKDAQRFDQKVGSATATIVRSAGLRKAVIVTANMPAAPAGKVYELWLQQGSAMVKAGFMPIGPTNTVLLDGDAATAAGAGITVEPAGGSDTPTLPPVALIRFA